VPVSGGQAIRSRIRRHLHGRRVVAVRAHGRQDMKAISKTVAGALVIASFIGGGALSAKLS
jgi:hypothetical protein